MKCTRYLTLGFEEAAKRETFFNLCDQHIDHAIQKHPLFAHCLTHDEDPGVYDQCAKDYKDLIKREVTEGKACVDNILDAEVNEFLAELARGNLTRAREEAADIIAVLYRALAMLESFTKN